MTFPFIIIPRVVRVPLALGSATTASQGATLSFTVTSAVPLGATIVVGAEWGSSNVATLGTITDSASNVYTQIDHQAMGNPTNGCGLFYATSANKLTTSQSIILNIANPAALYGATVTAMCFTSNSLDQHNTSTTTNSGNITTTTASEVIVGFFTYYIFGTFTEDSNFTSASGTLTHGGNNSQGSNLGYRVVTSTGTYNYNPTRTGSAGQDACFVSSFKVS